MNALELNAEVFVANSAVVQVTTEDVNTLKARAKDSPRGKCRLLLHRSADDALHEMLIAHAKDHYIRPQRNMGSAKSYQIVEGALAHFLFSNEGDVIDYYIMGPYGGHATFCLRLSESYSSYYHSLIPLTDVVVFLETRRGPFQGTTFAPWAPDASDSAAAQAYLERLQELIKPARHGASAVPVQLAAR